MPEPTVGEYAVGREPTTLGILLHLLDRNHDTVMSAISEVRKDVGDLRSEARKDISDLRQEMHKEISDLRQEMHNEVGDLREEVGNVKGLITAHMEPHSMSLVPQVDLTDKKSAEDKAIGTTVRVIIGFVFDKPWKKVAVAILTFLLGGGTLQVFKGCGANPPKITAESKAANSVNKEDKNYLIDGSSKNGSKLK